MSSSSRDQASLDPNEAGRREFSKARKGFAPNEVRAHMLALADEIKRLQGIESQLSAKVDQLEVRISDQGSLDPGHLTKVLGEETVRIIDAAREAADELRAHADETASRTIKEAQDRVNELNTEAAELRESSARDADELLGSARGRADELLADARRTADEVTREAEEDSVAMREKAARILADRTEEADAEAARIREAAQESKAEADAYASQTRTDSDEYADRVRRESDEMGARIRSDATAAAEQRAVEADEAADEEIEAARERGREMIREAKEAREKMLRDLAERRKTGRQQLEALRAGRERLLDAFEAARTALDGATEELVVSLPEARDAADAAARSVNDDIDEAVGELEQEIVASRERGARGSSDIDIDAETIGDVDEASAAETATAEVADTGDDEPETETETAEVGTDGDEVVADAGADGDEAVASDGDSESFEPADDDLAPQTGHLRLVASANPGGGTSVLDDDDFDDDDDDDDSELVLVGGDGDGGEGEHGADVEQLFARLRSAQPTDDDETDQAAGEHEAVVHPEATVIDLNPPGAETDDDSADADESSEVSAEQSLLDRRDDLLAKFEKGVARRLKRVLTDQENELLDRVRRDRKARGADDLLPAGSDTFALLAEAARADLTHAVEAGSKFLSTEGSDPDPGFDGSVVAAEISAFIDEWIQTPMRARLERVIAETDDRSHDRLELVDQLRSTYREWRNDRVPGFSGDLATLAFNRGILASAAPTASMCWFVDHGGLPCSDAEDNRLAGAVGVGEHYPTGNLCPPAHPGCRCLLMPLSH